LLERGIAMTATQSPPTILLSGKLIRADVEGAPIGAFDVIRDDVRLLSTIQPVDRVFVERTHTGYRGVLFSNERPHIFVLNGSGCVTKPLNDDIECAHYCQRLEDEERELTAQLDAKAADREMTLFNDAMDTSRLVLPRYGQSAAELEVGPVETKRVWGPEGPDPIERVPESYRKMMQGASISRMAGKDTKGVCGGGVVVNEAGKVLLVKPRNGHGGYDWTFPKGYPAKVDGGVLMQTAIREVREETGYRVFGHRYVGRFTHNDGGTCDYWHCDIDQSKAVGAFDEFETAAIRWVSVLEALELLNDDVDVKILTHANNLVSNLIIKGDTHSGTMVALQIPKAIAKTIALPGGEEPDDLHITLAYLGKGLSEPQKKAAISAVRKFAWSTSSIVATLGGVGRFSASGTSDGMDVVYLSVDSPQLTQIRPWLTEMLADAGLEVSQAHGFVPHVTLAYVKQEDKTPLQRIEPIEIKFKSIALVIASKPMVFLLDRRTYVRAKLGEMYGVDLNEEHDDAKKAIVKQPGKRGGKWHLDNKGHVQYGDKSEAKQGDEVSREPTPFPFERKPQVPGRFHSEATIGVVPLSKVIATQSYVTTAGLKKYAKAKRNKTSKATDLPLVYKTDDGRHYIADGHHRIVAAYKRGETEIQARIVNIGDPDNPVLKALPRLTDDQRDENAKRVGAKPGGASKKQMGANGKTRYSYPGEKGVQGKGGGESQPQQGDQGGEESGAPAQDVMPHPHTPPPLPEQSPIVADHPEKPSTDDVRGRDPQQTPAKHTLNVGELCAALSISREMLNQIVTRIRKQFGDHARSKFTSFMSTQMKDFVSEHGLDGDYFGLLFDVLTGKVPEGQPASSTADAVAVAKKPGA
jgi:2'-5' RNA ligase/8-oxo-dGTP pyrophosphatase MutT (NUDIX family)